MSDGTNVAPSLQTCCRNCGRSGHPNLSCLAQAFVSSWQSLRMPSRVERELLKEATATFNTLSLAMADAREMSRLKLDNEALRRRARDYDAELATWQDLRDEAADQGDRYRAALESIANTQQNYGILYPLIDIARKALGRCGCNRPVDDCTFPLTGDCR